MLDMGTVRIVAVLHNVTNISGIFVVQKSGSGCPVKGLT